MRSGLAAAISGLERRNKKSKDGASTLLDHLAKASIPGLEGASDTTIGETVRRLPVADYMLATRETLQVVLWLTRAVQGTFTEEKSKEPADAKGT